MLRILAGIIAVPSLIYLGCYVNDECPAYTIGDMDRERNANRSRNRF